jgi:hypothetical protein
VSGLLSLRARLVRLEAGQPTVRRFIVVAGVEAELDREAIAALPGETLIVTTGVPHPELRPQTVWEIGADGHWRLAGEALAA